MENNSLLKGKLCLPEVKSFFWDYLSLILSKSGVILLTFVITALITRLLGPENYGSFSLFIMVAQVLVILLGSWSSGAVIRFGKEEYIKEEKINKVFWSRMIMLIPSFFLGIFLVAIFRQNILTYISLPSWTIWLILGYFLIYSLSEFLYGVFQATNKLKSLALIELFESLFLLLGLGLAKIFVGSNLYILAVVIGLHILSKFLIDVAFLSRFNLKIFFPIELDRKVVRKMLIFSYPYIFSTIAAYVINWVDIIVIKKYLGLFEVGVYSLAYKIGNFLRQFGLVLNTIFFPLMVGLLSRKRKDLINLYFQRIIPQVVFLWGIILFFIFILSQPLIPIFFGESFAGSVSPFIILLIGYYINIFAMLCSSILVTFELIKQVVLVNFLAMLLNLGFDLLLIPKIGINGAAIATAMVFIFGGISYFFLTNRLLGLRERRPLFILIPFLIFFIFNILFQNTVYLLGSGIILAIIVFFMAKRFDLFRQEDKKIFEAIDMPDFLRRGIYKIIDKLSPLL